MPVREPLEESGDDLSHLMGTLECREVPRAGNLHEPGVWDAVSEDAGCRRRRDQILVPDDDEGREREVGEFVPTIRAPGERGQRADERVGRLAARAGRELVTDVARRAGGNQTREQT